MADDAEQGGEQHLTLTAMECHGSVDRAKSEPMCLFISVGDPELQNEGQHNSVRVKGRSPQRCESGDLDVAPGVCRNKAGKWIH